MMQRENTIRTIKFDHPERVSPGPLSYMLTYQGCNHEGYTGCGDDHAVGEMWTDIWGTQWHKEFPDVMGFPYGYPLADPVQLDSYQWPNPDDPRICGKIYEMLREYQAGDVFLAGQHRDTLWEKAYMLVGMENMMEYLYTEPDYAREVLHRIMDFQIGIARHYIEAGIEMIWAGDDLGTQCAPLLNPKIVEEFFVPEYKRLFGLYKSRGVIINFHSCGHIEEFLDMFIDLGVDVLNPVQATANDLERVRNRTQGKMALLGGVSTQIIMDGPVERIREEVRKRLWQLGKGGGYFCSPDQGMPFPKENIDAFYKAVDDYGVYPLNA
ncbi:MAG: uroporphyrinogen decarboxylase family protein [Armatimonadota bacterium]|nr:hypothetical protein [bacterium]